MLLAPGLSFPDGETCLAPLSGNKARAAQRKAVLLKVNMQSSTLHDIFEPILEILKIKSQDMDRQLIVANEFKRWLDGKPPAGDSAESMQYLQEGDALEQALLYSDLWRSFSSKEDPDRWRRAADYSEQLVSGVAGAFNYYFICRGHDSTEDSTCWRIVSSKKWTTFKEDPIAAQQRWYCTACGCRYLTNMGVLIEIYVKGIACYCIAEFPPSSILDARGLAIESRFQSDNETIAE